MDTFTAYRMVEQPTVSTYTTPWIQRPENKRPPFGGKAAMLKAAKRGHVRGVQSRQVGRMLDREH